MCNRGKLMAENQTTGWGKKFLLWAVTSPITLIFSVLMLYYGIRAYVMEIDPWRSKAIMMALAVLWVLWLVFKNLIKFLLLAAIAAAVFYGYYQYENRDKIACKKEGRVWNEEKNICEDKLDWMDKLENLWQEYMGSDDEDETAGDVKADNGAQKNKKALEKPAK